MKQEQTKPAALGEYADILNDIQAAPKNPTTTMNAAHTIPTEGLPGKIVDYCRHVAETRNVPMEYALMTAVVTAGVAAGGYVESYIDGYRNKPGINLLVVAPSAAGKSQVMEDILKPIKDIDRELLARYSEQLKNWRADNAKAKNPEPRPAKTQIVCQAKTDAARIEFVADNPRGGILYNNELRAFFKTLSGRFNTTGMEYFLEISDFNGIKIDTKGSDEIKVCNSSFRPVMGGIQTELIPDTITPELINNGILNRFEIVMFESDNLPTFGERRGIDVDMAAYWNRIIRGLREIGNVTDASGTMTYTLSTESQQAFNEFGKKFVGDIKADLEDSPAAASFRQAAYKKIVPTIHRLALIAHLLHMADTDQHQYQYHDFHISADAVKWAFGAAPYLLHNKMYVYNLAVGKPKPRTDAEVIRELAANIRRKGRKVNQAALAEATGISRPNINFYINGK